ncbi:MAG: adenosylcobinamide kinase / adenosylcobinamide-phosphate guanylyltransferase [Pseudonocardiales bacterium]|nr:adenosylcobinamide kinase / adenosylcobinamide-phosphate guanylyltransferase [Pseudonocardiales bacterium]
MSRVLVLGGSRSGKSAFAESLLAGAGEVEYVATAAHRPNDDEWAHRIAAHRARRPAGWRTVETGDLAGVLGATGGPVLIDSVTAWLARTMDETGCWAAPPGAPPAECAERIDLLCTRWASAARDVVAVSDEVGSGVVPETASGRLFCDSLGALNQRLAAAADEVQLVVAGIPLRLK